MADGFFPSLGLFILLAVSIFCVAMILIALLWFNTKRREREPDPLVRSIGMGGFFFLCMLLYRTFGGEDGKEFFGKWWWLSLAVAGLIFAFYMIASRKKRAIPFEKLLRDFAWPQLGSVFNLKMYAGQSAWPGVIAHNVVEMGVEQELRDVVDVILVYGEFVTGSVKHALVALNAKTGHNVQMIFEPDTSTIQKLMGAESVAAFKTWADEFVQESVEESKSEEEAKQ